MYSEKFTNPFVEFVDEHFDSSQHLFLIKQFKNYKVEPQFNIKLIESSATCIKEFLMYFRFLNRAKKIIIHGLFDRRFVMALFLQPWVLKKCCWVIWGGDLYFYNLRPHNLKTDLYEFVRRKVIKKIGNIATYSQGDYMLARQWYDTSAKFHESFVYKSNLFVSLPETYKFSDKMNILVGNSANPTNNHFNVLDELVKYRDQNIQIYCPLSYGGEDNARKVVSYGKSIFGAKFTPLMDFMSLEKYLELLSSIDIAIFDSERQQAFGNTISLLGMGKKVFLNKKSTLNSVFINFNIRVYSASEINLEIIDSDIKAENIKNVGLNFSENRLIKSLEDIFR